MVHSLAATAKRSIGTAGSGFPKQRSRVQTPFLLFDSVVLCMVCNQKWLAEWVGAASLIVASNTN